MTEADEIWDRLKHGIRFDGPMIVSFMANGIATKYNSGWISDASKISVSVDGLAKSAHRDFSVDVNTIVFNTPPPDGAHIAVRVDE